MSQAVWIHGLSGRMGLAIKNSVAASGGKYSLAGGSTSSSIHFRNHSELNLASLVEGLTASGVIFDFSTSDGNRLLNQAAAKTSGGAFLIGTTGLTETDHLAWAQISKTTKARVLLAPNTSIGVLIFRRMLKFAAPVLLGLDFDCEIVESHHRNKKDSPSGTALSLAAAIQSSAEGFVVNSSRHGQRKPNEIGISALRGGSVIGEHEVQFLSDAEEFRIQHRALSRELFATGALRLGSWLTKQSAGFYNLDDVKVEEL